jgi:S1-C subfamily serine protease
MIPSNVIYRVFYLKYPKNNKTGTCFTLDIEGKQYFITAQHVVDGLNDGEKIELFYKNKWEECQITLIGHSNVADISVFAIKNQSFFAHPIIGTTAKMIYGQDLYFLGFPYGYYTDVGEINRGFPLPLVKKGILSNMPTKDIPNLLIDGHNNPGFSGGPVVFKDIESNDYFIAGVVTGFYREHDEKDEILENTNSGIILAPVIKYALDLISENPIGTEIL